MPVTDIMSQDVAMVLSTIRIKAAEQGLMESKVSLRSMGLSTGLPRLVSLQKHVMMASIMAILDTVILPVLVLLIFLLLSVILLPLIQIVLFPGNQHRLFVMERTRHIMP